MPTREEKRWEYFRERKQVREVRKQVKRSHEEARVRQKDWMLADPDDLDSWDEVEVEQFERVMPRGEQERRKAVLATAIAKKQKEEMGSVVAPASVPPSAGQQGLVTEVSAGLCRVEVGGKLWLYSLHPSLGEAEQGFTNVVAVGDEVLVARNGPEEGIVTEVLPRRSILARSDYHDDWHNNHRRQVIVANAEQLLIVSAWREPAIWLELIDRYLITAQRDGLVPIICVNKTDLSSSRDECMATLKPYSDLGHRVLLTSVLRGEGIAALRELLRGRTTVLAGLSGVGKSSLLSAVQPGLNLRVAATSARRHEGRHTTSQVNLFSLQMGGRVIDTPGIRDFDLGGLQRVELINYYPELVGAAAACRFANCTHNGEQGCAVREAVKQGRVPESRYHSYQKILESLP